MRDIDPLACPDRDPDIRILQGSFRDANPGWPEGEFENQNNHSLVTRVQFGTASFLFMGDLEAAGIELLVDHYGETPASRQFLNADVLQVGHHGSYNATTQQLLSAVTPRVAVIPVGFWKFGQAASEGRSPRSITATLGTTRSNCWRVTSLGTAASRKA